MLVGMLREGLLNREILYSACAAQITTDDWKGCCNANGPRSAPGGRLSAQEAVVQMGRGLLMPSQSNPAAGTKPLRSERIFAVR